MYALDIIIVVNYAVTSNQKRRYNSVRHNRLHSQDVVM